MSAIFTRSAIFRGVTGFAAGRAAAAPSAQLIGARRYHERVHDHFENPRNTGELSGKDPNVGQAVVGKVACGDVIKMSVRIEDGIVRDAKFKAFGCGSAIASSSLATEMIVGKTIDEALAVKNSDIAQHLKLPPVKIHCSVLAEDAIRAAIGSYNEKNFQKGQAEADL